MGRYNIPNSKAITRRKWQDRLAVIAFLLLIIVALTSATLYFGGRQRVQWIGECQSKFGLTVEVCEGLYQLK